ncbi:MAG TPA: glutathione S-transferase family protein [Solirubrobacteraceae bacterium]|nr:glutathione S-transferase family protein [Solirubrobacteraceae bacterium]
MLLYDSPVSGNCYKVRLLLAQLGLAYERRSVDVVDRTGRAELLGDLNPAWRIPVLVLDDGRPLAESNAILCHLAGGTPHLPDDGYVRSQVLQWLFFEQNLHEPNIAVVRFWLSFAAERPPAPEIASRQAAGYQALAVMENHLASHDFLVDDRYTIADIALYAYTHVAGDGDFDLHGHPAISRWLARVAAEPGHVTIDA